MLGFHCDIEKQIQLLYTVLSKSGILMKVIQESEEFGLKDYYIGAGCICQSVWNYQNGLDALYGISDIDFVYYDSSDLSYEAENRTVERIRGRFSHLPVSLDVKNQARVHLWYRGYFGYDLKPYDSLESAIDSWPTTASAVGVRMKQGKFIVYAPYGLNDLFGQIIRANKVQITKETYEQKCKKWMERWNSLTIIEW